MQARNALFSIQLDEEVELAGVVLRLHFINAAIGLGKVLEEKRFNTVKWPIAKDGWTRHYINLQNGQEHVFRLLFDVDLVFAVGF